MRQPILAVILLLFALASSAMAQPYDRSAARAEICIRIEDKLVKVNRKINASFSQSDVNTMQGCGIYSALNGSRGRVQGKALDDLLGCYNAVCNLSSWGRNCFGKAALMRDSFALEYQLDDFRCPK